MVTRELQMKKMHYFQHEMTAVKMSEAKNNNNIT